MYKSSTRKYKFDPGKSDLSQQFCQSINTSWLRTFLVNKFFGGKYFLVKENLGGKIVDKKV